MPLKKKWNQANTVYSRIEKISETLVIQTCKFRADKVASYPLKTIDSSGSIIFAARLMSEKKIRKLVVVENDKVVGIITSIDLVNQLAKKKKRIGFYGVVESCVAPELTADIGFFML